MSREWEAGVDGGPGGIGECVQEQQKRQEVPKSPSKKETANTHICMYT